MCTARHVVRVHICKTGYRLSMLQSILPYDEFGLFLLCPLLFDSFMVYFCRVKLICSEMIIKHLQNLPFLFDFTW